MNTLVKGKNWKKKRQEAENGVIDINCVVGASSKGNTFMQFNPAESRTRMH